MQIKRVQCPQCSVVLDVKNSKNETVKQIACPSCKTILQIKFSTQQEPLTANTYYAPPQKSAADNGATQLVSPTHKTHKSYLQYADHTYPLSEGQNIIGRKGNTSKATVQIDTADRYMSRQHVSITVTTLPDGNVKAVLSNYQNKNFTTIDGQEIETGDAIRLADGNCIKMGHTTVIFKLS